MGGSHDGTPTWTHAVAISIGARGIGQHNAGAVIIGEYHRALMGTCCDDDLLGTHLPEAITRKLRIGLGEMIGDLLDKSDKILREITEGLRACQKRYRAGKAC